MPLPAWPGVPYAPLRHGWSKQPLLPPIRTEMEGGNVRQRQRPGDNVAILTQTVRMSLAEFATLEAWVAAAIGQGVGQFTMQVWLGNAFESKTVQFEANGNSFPFAVTAVGPGAVAVAMTLRVFDV